jgi:hypothetical protein
MGVGLIRFGLAGYYSENTIIFGYGRKIEYSYDKLPGLALLGNGNLSIGVNLKMLRKKYEKTLYTENAINMETGAARGANDPVFDKGYAKDGFSIDMGFLYLIKEHISVAAVFNDINEPDMGLHEPDKVHLTAKLAISYSRPYFNLCFDVSNRDNMSIYAAGAERWFFKKMFALRCGFGAGDNDYLNASTGISWQYARILRLDYGFNYPLKGVTDFSGSHRISVNVKFGSKKRP